MNLSAIMTPITKFGAKALFKVKANSPKILIALGIVGTVGAVVLACKETLNVEDIVEEHKESLEATKLCIDDDQVAYRKSVFMVYANTSWRLIRNYAPATSLLFVSLGCILYSHGIMSRRNLELLAAYKTLEESFSTYKKRIKERYGDYADFDASFVHEHEDEKSDFVDKDGKVSPGHYAQINGVASPYARFFDETNINWEKDPSTNLFFLQAQEKFANQKLQSQGFIFLNDVYDALGIPRSSAGQLVGWYLGGDGDDYVSFGIFDGNNPKKRDFVNGLEPAILLDFNVDGVIYDLI